MSNETSKECGKPGPCDWCDALQSTEDRLFFENQKDEEYEGEALDRGYRLARMVSALEAVIERGHIENEAIALQLAELQRLREREALVRMLVRDVIVGESHAIVTARAVRDFKVTP